MEDINKEDEKIDFNMVKDHLMDYLNNRLKSFQLTVIEYVAKILPVFVFVAIIALVILVFWIFGNIAAALAIGRAIDNIALGLLIMAIFNLILGAILVFAFKDLIHKPVSNWIVKILSLSLESDENK